MQRATTPRTTRTIKTTSAASPRATRAALGAYLSLAKPHVTIMLLGTTLAAMAVAQHGAPPLGVTLATLGGGAMAAGSANAINCYWDRDIDRVMSRTQRRTLPAGKVSETHALIFGLGLGVGAFIVLATWVNLLAALLATSAILFYVGVYTMWLKRSTPQNIVIGGAAGAVPVLVGWAAITGHLGLTPLLMFAIIFLWTPPHFWALSLVLKKDYARAGVPMLPVVRGDETTRRQIFGYTLVLVAASLVLVATGAMGAFYLAAAGVMGGGLVILALRLLRSRTIADARLLFWCSNYYLALLFAAMVVDQVVR